MKSVWVLLACTLLFTPWGWSSGQDEIAITNVNVVDMRSGTVSHKLLVLVQNGRIKSIAHVGLIGQSSHLRVINATGKYMIPGLWDMHVHSAFATAPAWTEQILMPLYLANGITGIRDMGGDMTVLQQRKRRIDRGELAGPHMFIGGPFLDGSKNDAQTLAVDTPDKAHAAVDQVKQQGFDFVKILSRVPRDSYYAISTEAAKQGISFVGHVPDSVTAAEASAAGQRSIEHLSGIIYACSSKADELRKQRDQARAKRDAAAYAAAAREAVETCDPSKAHALYSIFRTNKTWQAPTLVWTHAQAYLDAPGIADDPRMKYVPLAVRPDWSTEKLLKNTTAQEMADAKKEFSIDQQLAGAMQKAGVMFLAGSDGPDPYVFPGFALHDELQLLVKSGFTPLQALQAATFNPALFLGKLDDYGLVEPGHVADLILLKENPLEDIRNTQKIDAVVAAGKYYSREDLDRMMKQAEEAAAKPADPSHASH